MDFPEIIKKNDIKELEDFLKNNDVNEEVHGQSLLFWAVHLGNLEFAKVLIKKGASVNQKDSLGRTPLSISAFFGFTEIAKLLLENNAQIDATSMYRAYNGWDGHIQSDILKLFKEYE
ncbi:ankyrin repeat domain-containing protein [Caldifermentibacillus hisashii]|uniref:ankyrin repeat domain-containing protein n=1 Tax=Caldifermentibacillus hisashii TaxID=996558 RepID=UPI00342A5FF6